MVDVFHLPNIEISKYITDQQTVKSYEFCTIQLGTPV